MCCPKGMIYKIALGKGVIKMANSCRNKVTIYGANAEVRNFVEGCIAQEQWPKDEMESFSFARKVFSEKEYPTNSSMKVIKEDAHIRKYGTLYNESEFELHKDDHITFHFSTVTKPPVEWFKTVSEIFPQYYMVLTYHEPGHGIAGYMETFKGNFNDFSSDTWETYVEVVYGTDEVYSMGESPLCLSCEEVKVPFDEILNRNDTHILCVHCLIESVGEIA